MFIYNLQIYLYITVDKSFGRVYDTDMRKEGAAPAGKAGLVSAAWGPHSALRAAFPVRGEGYSPVRKETT